MMAPKKKLKVPPVGHLVQVWATDWSRSDTEISRDDIHPPTDCMIRGLLVKTGRDYICVGHLEFDDGQHKGVVTIPKVNIKGSIRDHGQAWVAWEKK